MDVSDKIKTVNSSDADDDDSDYETGTQTVNFIKETAFEFGFRLQQAEQIFGAERNSRRSAQTKAKLRHLSILCEHNALLRLQLLRDYYMTQLNALHDDVITLHDCQLTTWARIELGVHQNELRIEEKHTPFEAAESVAAAAKAVMVHWKRMCAGIAHNKRLRTIWPSIRPSMLMHQRAALEKAVCICEMCHKVIVSSMRFLARMHPQQLRDIYTDRIAECLAAFNLLLPTIRMFGVDVATKHIQLPPKFTMTSFLDMMSTASGQFIADKVLLMAAEEIVAQMPRSKPPLVGGQPALPLEASNDGLTVDDPQHTSDYFSGSANSERSQTSDSIITHDVTTPDYRKKADSPGKMIRYSYDNFGYINDETEHADGKAQARRSSPPRLAPVSASLPVLGTQQQETVQVEKQPLRVKSTREQHESLEYRLEQLYASYLEQRYIVFLAFVDSASAHRSLNQEYRPKRKPRQPRRICWLDDCLKHYRRKWWRHYVRMLCRSMQENFVINWLQGRQGLVSMQITDSATQAALVNLYNTVVLAMPLPNKFMCLEPDLIALAHVDQQQQIHQVFCNALSASFGASTALPIPATANTIITSKINETNVSTTSSILNGCRHYTPVGVLFDQLLNMCKDADKNQPTSLPISVIAKLNVWWLEVQSLRLLASFQLSDFMRMCFCDTSLARRQKVLDEAVLNMIVKKLNSKISQVTAANLKLLLPSKTLWRSRNASALGRRRHVTQISGQVVRPIIDAISQVPGRYKAKLLKTTASTIVLTWLEYFIDHKITLKLVQLLYSCSRIGAAALAHDLDQLRKQYTSADSSAGEPFDIVIHQVHALHGTAAAQQSQTQVSYHVAVDTRVHPVTNNNGLDIASCQTAPSQTTDVVSIGKIGKQRTTESQLSLISENVLIDIELLDEETVNALPWNKLKPRPLTHRLLCCRAQLNGDD